MSLTGKQPAPLHYLACYVLHLMQKRLADKGLHDSTLNHRLIFEHVLFFVSDSLRKINRSCEMTMQIKFYAVIDQNKPAFLNTVESTLAQCVHREPPWMKPPNATCLNYKLTSEGMGLITPILEGRNVQYHCNDKTVKLFDQKTINTATNVIDEWVGRPPHDLRPEFIKIARSVLKDNEFVPYYGFSPGFKPFIASATGQNS